MSKRIVTAPSVALVASSRMNLPGLQEFIKAEELDHILENELAPLARILERVGGDESEYSLEETLPEFGGRFCYRSWEKGRPTDAYNANILAEAHGSVLRHTYLSFAITGVSRTLSHELVRHHAGFEVSQESQRYVDMTEARFVLPPLMLHVLGGDHEDEAAMYWLERNLDAVKDYEGYQAWLGETMEAQVDEGHFDGPEPCGNTEEAIKRQRRKTLTRLKKRVNEASRSALPGAAETKLLWTVNLEAARNFILNRGADPADLEIRRLAAEIARQCIAIAPTVFHDIEITAGEFGVPVVTGKYTKAF